MMIGTTVYKRLTDEFSVAINCLLIERQYG